MPSSAMMNGSGGDIFSSNGKYLAASAQPRRPARLLLAASVDRARPAGASLAAADRLPARPMARLRLVKTR